MKKFKYLIAFMSIGLMLTGCGEEETQHNNIVHTQVQEPTYQQPQEVHHYNHNTGTGAGDVMMGVAAGALIGNALSDKGGSSHKSTTTINKTYISPTTKTVSPTIVSPKTSGTTTVTKTTSKVDEKPAKASYRTEAAKKPQTAGTKAKYREKVKTTSYKPAPKKSTYRPKPKKTTSSWYKKSSYKSSYRK